MYNSAPRSSISKFSVIAILMITDVLVIEAALYVGYEIRLSLIGIFPIGFERAQYIGIAAGVLAVPLANLLMQIYPGYGINEVEQIRRRTLSLAIVFSSLMAWDYVVQDGTWSRGILLATWLIATPLAPIVSVLVRKALIALGLWGAPLVIIGAGSAGRALAASFRGKPEMGLNPVGFLDYDPSLAGNRIDDLPVLGGLDLVDELARRVPFAAVAVSEFSGAQVADVCAQLPFPHVIIMPDFEGLQSNWVSPRDIGGELGLEVKKNLLLPWNRGLKRIIDYAVAVPLFILALPLLGGLVGIVVLLSPGNPFFRQERVGAGGRPFSMLKIRTMYPDAQDRLTAYLAENDDARTEWLTRFKLRDDPRILPYIGSFLRRSSLDELPQLWNVFRGEMSLVGPRPFPKYHLAAFDESFRSLRESVRPGLTGLWQIEVRSESDIEKQKYFDSYYIRNWSLWLDIYVLFRTVTAVTSGKGAE